MREQPTPAMADRGRFWPELPDWATAKIVRNGWSAEPVLGLGQVMISGDLHAARRALAPHAVEVGLWQVADGLPALVRVSRDRAMLVTSEPLGLSGGWAGTHAASPADHGWAILRLQGPAVGELLAEMTAVDLTGGSPSAAIALAGVTALLYRVALDVAHLHVEAPSAAYLWHWLETRADA